MLSAMQSFVGQTKFLEAGSEEGLVLDSLSSTQGGQSVQSHIDADSGGFVHRTRIRDFDLDGHKPPVRRFGNPCAHHLAFETQILGHVDPSKLGYPDAMIAQLKLIVGEIEARFTSLLAFKAWVAGTALKKRRKRFAQVQNRLIRSILRHLPGPR